MEESAQVIKIDAILAQHRAFGDAGYIQAQLVRCYKRRLAEVAAGLPSAARLSAAIEAAADQQLWCFFGETVARCAVNHARCQLLAGGSQGLSLDECEEVFEALLPRLLRQRECPHRPDSAVAAELGHISVWRYGESDDVVNGTFRRLTTEPFGELHEPSAGEIMMLGNGIRLLREILPHLTGSALYHVHRIALFPEAGRWNGAASMSQFALGGTIFLNQGFIHNPWWVAEQVLHESLHQKLYDFRHGHTLLEPNFSRDGAARVCSLWNVPGPRRSNYWDAHRALAAFHVYVHLALLASVAEQRTADLETEFGPKCAMIASRTALDRARYLGEQIRDTCREELGLAGRRLVEWMLTILEALDPAPPAPGSHVHLLLDRYQREAHIFKRNMERSCEGERPGSRDDFEHDLPEKIRQIVQREIESVRQYLSSVGAGAQSAQLDAAIKGYGTAEFVTNLAGIRGVIAGAVLNAPRYGSIGATGSFDPEHPEEILRHMIEKSSEQLGVLSCMA